MSIRRFTSVIKLVDEEDYDELVNILENPSNRSPAEIVEEIRTSKNPFIQSSFQTKYTT